MNGTAISQALFISLAEQHARPVLQKMSCLTQYIKLSLNNYAIERSSVKRVTLKTKPK